MKPLLTILLAVLVFRVSWGAASPAAAVARYEVFDVKTGQVLARTAQRAALVFGTRGQNVACRVVFNDGHAPLTSNIAVLK